MEDLYKQEVFVVAGTKYNWADVVAAAKLRGDWATLEDETRQAIACLKRESSNGETLAPGDIASAAREFRYTYNLISAEEVESWLKNWGLTVEEWMGYFRSVLLRHKWSEQLGAIVATYPVTDTEIANSIKTIAVCSGKLVQFARRLANRAAAYDKLKSEKKAEQVSDDTSNRLEKTARITVMETAFEQFRNALMTPEAIQARILSQRIEWIKFDCRYVEFPEEHLAKEAALCVREDGLELHEVAADAQRDIRHHSFYLEDAELVLKSNLLGASKRELIGPYNSNGQYVLLLVLDKQLPSERDRNIRERAEYALLKSALEHEVNNRVQWSVVL